MAVVPPAAAAPVNDRPPPGLGWAVPLVHSDELVPPRTLPATSAVIPAAPAVISATPAVIPTTSAVILTTPAVIPIPAPRSTIATFCRRRRRKRGTVDDHRGGNSCGTKARAK